jgi:hypothetical protein
MLSRVHYLIVILFIMAGMVTAGIILMPLTTRETHITSGYVTIDTDPLYRSGNETTVSTRNNFFQNQCLEYLPLTLGDWNGTTVNMDPATYDFYLPEEISGRYYTRGNTSSIYLVAIQGPKVHWHNPSNCYIFSDWNIVESRYDPIDIMPVEGGLISLPTTQLSVEKNGDRYLINYFYLFRERSDFNNITMMMVISPVDTEYTANQVTHTFTRALFDGSRYLGNRKVRENFPTEEGANTNGITQWLNYGPRNVSIDQLNECPYCGFQDMNYDPATMISDTSTNMSPPVGGAGIINGTFGFVQLDRIFGPGDLRSTVTCEYIYSTNATPVMITISSDDGERVWLNGELIHSRTRGEKGKICLDGQYINLSPDFEQTFLINLKSGWNHICIEVLQWKGSWEFFTQLKDLKGNPLEDIIYTVQAPPEGVFSERRPHLSPLFQIGYEDQKANEFSSEWYTGDDFYVGESFREFERAVSKKDPVSRVHFIVPEEEALTGRTLSIGAVKVDNSKIGFIRVNLSINDKFIGTFSYPEDWLKNQYRIPDGILQEGTNTLALTWIGGEEYIVWDYIRMI